MILLNSEKQCIYKMYMYRGNQQTFVRKVIIEGAPIKKIAGKGKITSERASSGRHATYRTQTS
jgi:hypothetical protein